MNHSEALPRRLNIGCGFDTRPGYLNVDLNEFHKPDLVSDVTSLPSLPSDYFHEVLAQDVLEHLPRGKIDQALTEWHRLMSPGGILRLRVPNLIGLFQLLTDTRQQSIESQTTLVQCTYGTQAYEGDFHLAGFTPRILVNQLEAAGFENVHIARKDEWLMESVARKRGGSEQFDVNLVGNDAVCIVGWHRVQETDGKLFRWSAGRSLLNLRRFSGRRLRIVCSASGTDVLKEPVRVQIRDATNDVVIENVALGWKAPQVIELIIATDDFLVELLTQTTFVPAIWDPSETDYRHLGFALDALEVL